MSRNFRGKCGKDCKYYSKTGTPGHGVCTILESFEPCEEGMACPFCRKIDAKAMTCGEHCARWAEDFNCCTVPEDKPICQTGFGWDGLPYAFLCIGFEDKLKYKFFEVCDELFHRGVPRINVCLDKWLEEFQKTHKDPWQQIFEEEEKINDTGLCAEETIQGNDTETDLSATER